MSKTYVETFSDMVNMMVEKESFTSDPNSVNSVYMGNIALSLAAIADELHEIKELLKKDERSEKDNIVRLDHLASDNEINELRKESPNENTQEPEYPQPEFAYDLMIDATTVVSLMYNEIETKGYVSVADVKRFSNTESHELDNFYGWYNIDPFDTLEISDFSDPKLNKYVLRLPKVERIKEIK